MASNANLNLWPDLSGLGLSETNSADARAVLLKVNAEMFVSAPAHDRESLETFETLVLGFLPRTDHATLIELARILAPCKDTPAAILDDLSRRSPELRDIVLGHGVRLSDETGARLLTTPEGRRQLASSPDLDPGFIERLLVLRDPVLDEALAANPAFDPTSSLFSALVRRAQEHPPLARILLGRADLTVMDEASLYLVANAERRARIRDRVAASMNGRRIVLSFNLTEQDVGAFLAACRQGDVRRLEALLTSAFGFPAATDWRVLQIGRHRLLAVALKALGVSEREATRMFLTLHPALCCPLSALKELVREIRGTPSAIALALVEAVLDAKVAPESCGRI
jgi:hypothetical protein